MRPVAALFANQGTNALVVLWRLAIPSAGLDLEVRPQLPDAEFDATRSTGTVYWEGPVRVSSATSGEGYAELTGYATSLARHF